MIKINRINKEYVIGTKVVKNLTLDVRPGEIFGFLGPNGAGKTTTLKMITGVSSIDSGNIEINGVDIAKEPLEAKKQFGFVPDSPDMFLRLKGIEYLNFMAKVYGVSYEDAKNRIEDYAKRFEIYDALNKQIKAAVELDCFSRLDFLVVKSVKLFFSKIFVKYKAVFIILLTPRINLLMNHH